MPTQKECHICKEKIGVASKTCQHCGAKQPYKQKLEKRKKEIAHDWKNRQKKNCSVNKVYDATHLLLHKWELLERHPILLLARRTTNGFLAECFCPWQMGTEDAKDALVAMKKIYESLLNATEPPLTNSAVTREEVLQENNESSTPAEPQTSADTKTDDGNYCLVQTDFKMSEIKEEQEEFGIDSQTQQVIFPSLEVVKSEQDKEEMQVTYEMQPISSDCSGDQSEDTDSDEDWVQSKEAETKKKKQKAKGLQRQNSSMNETLSDGDSSAKTQKDRSLCPVCGKGFQYIRPLMKHINTHKKTSKSAELVSNLQSARNKHPDCDICGKTFTSLGSLQMHLKTHTRIEGFKCQDCT
ncbi:hypothetical protein PAMP_009250 [Pampus punctatissimus]